MITTPRAAAAEMPGFLREMRRTPPKVFRFLPIDIQISEDGEGVVKRISIVPFLTVAPRQDTTTPLPTYAVSMSITTNDIITDDGEVDSITVPTLDLVFPKQYSMPRAKVRVWLDRWSADIVAVVQTLVFVTYGQDQAK